MGKVIRQRTINVEHTKKLQEHGDIPSYKPNAESAYKKSDDIDYDFSPIDYLIGFIFISIFALFVVANNLQELFGKR